MEKYDLVIKSDKIFTDGRLIDCYIGVKNGIVVAISKEKLDADEVMKERLSKVVQKMLLWEGLLR